MEQGKERNKNTGRVELEKLMNNKWRTWGALQGCQCVRGLGLCCLRFYAPLAYEKQEKKQDKNIRETVQKSTHFKNHCYKLCDLFSQALV